MPKLETTNLDIISVPLSGINLIEASAGTGKTFTISHLYLRFILEQGLTVDKILVVTFTEMATKELCTRLRDNLKSAYQAICRYSTGNYEVEGKNVLFTILDEYLKGKTEDEIKIAKKNLHYAIISFDEAAIFTIHGFCKRMLTENAFESKLPFELELVSDDAELIDEIINDFWRTKIYPMNEEELSLFLNQKLDKKFFKDIVMYIKNASNIKFASEYGGESCDLLVDSDIEISKDFIDYFRETYIKRKQEAQIQTFDDILLNLRDALRSDKNDAYIKLIQSKFQAVMIDEFQDTDSVQYEIFSSIFMDKVSEGRSLFLIGDPKQSIYKFRGADIFSYLKVKNVVKEIKTQGNIYNLDTNYRSECLMVDAINDFFETNQDSLKYPFIEKNIPYNPIKSAGVQNELILKGQGSDLGTAKKLHFLKIYSENIPTFNKENATAHTVRTVALEILKLLNSKSSFHNSNTNEEKVVEPGDIAILVQAHKDAMALQKELSKYLIPSVLQSSGNVFEAPEAEDLLYFLNAILEPSQKTIHSALLTPFFENTLDDLIKFDNHILEEKYHIFIALHQSWEKNGFINMMRYFLNEENVRARLLAKEYGERSLTNIIHLMEIIHRESLRNKMTVSSAILWLSEQIKEPENNPEYEVRLERDDNAVKLLTVHASKGLEFPIVFCPFEWTRLFKKKSSKVIKYNNANGISVLDICLKRDSKNPPISLYKETLSENIRLLYVAMTRAKNMCYVALPTFASIHQSAFMYLLNGLGGNNIDDYIKSKDKNPRKNNPYIEPFFNELDKKISLFQNTLSLKEIDLTKETVKCENYKVEIYNANSLYEPSAFCKIDKTWAVASFSWLTRNVVHEYKHDENKLGENTQIDLDSLVVNTSSELIIPKGANTGSAIHEVLEEIDFMNTQIDKEIIKDKVKKYGLASVESQRNYDLEVEKLTNAIAEMIKEVLNTQISQLGDFTLSKLSKNKCLTEMEFYYPINSISPRILAELFHKYGKGNIKTDFAQSMEELKFNSSHGFMHGFIDLIFEYDRRYYILDWKSNYLGESYEDYSQNAIQESMLDSYYILQYHLYVLATHLYLKKHLKDYTYQENFGGVIYAYVRGMSKEKPADSIYFDKPNEQLIKKLAQLIKNE